MKKSFVLVGLLLCGQVVGWELTSEDIKSQNEGLARLRAATVELADNPSQDLILKLAAGLRKTAMRSIYSVDNSSEIHHMIKESLLSVPGHARHIAAEVERNRKEGEHLPRGNQTSYDRVRRMLIDETLKHLPSPETIQVLGHYLDDERDAPPRLEFLPENSFLACVALSEIGLRNPPVSSRPGIHNWREELVKQKSWYAQIKAGTIPFSFIGQKVEYRFKLDGTWDIIALANSPDDGPRRVKAEQPGPVRPSRRSTVDRDSSGKSENGSPWLWVIGIPVLLLAGALWLRFRNSANFRLG